MIREIEFAADSPLEEGVSSEPVSEARNSRRATPRFFSNYPPKKGPRRPKKGSVERTHLLKREILAELRLASGTRFFSFSPLKGAREGRKKGVSSEPISEARILTELHAPGILCRVHVVKSLDQAVEFR
jgi:hypothetical protein